MLVSVYIIMSVFLVCDHEPMHHKYITFKYINILGLSRSQDSSVSIPGSHSPYIGSAVDSRRWLQNGDPIKRTKVVTVWSGCCIGYTHTTSKEDHDSVRNGNWHAIRIYCTVTLQSIVQKERERETMNERQALLMHKDFFFFFAAAAAADDDVP